MLVLYTSGQLGNADSPFAMGSVRRQLEVVGGLYEQVFALAFKRPPLAARKRLASVQALTRVVTTRNAQLQL